VRVECFASKIITQNYPDKQIGNCVSRVDDVYFRKCPFEHNKGSLRGPEVEKRIFIDFAYMKKWWEKEDDEREHDH
jgi:hypothetical protein